LTRRARLKKVQPALAYAATHLDEDLSLATLAGEAFHMHRVFSAAMGETPKQLTLRLRLEHSAAMLLTSDATVLDVALSSGPRAIALSPSPDFRLQRAASESIFSAALIPDLP
jgi:AraC family transcriptional regulator